jgi:2'-5' RNA ligase
VESGEPAGRRLNQPRSRATAGHVLQFAILADAVAAEEVALLLAEYRKRDTPSGRPVGPEALHIALNLVGEFEDYPEPIVERASLAAGGVVAAPFWVALDTLVTWAGLPGQRPLVLAGLKGAAGVEQLYDRLAEALAEWNIPAAERPPLVAHMTIARGVAAQEPEPAAPVSWRVREFVLTHTPPGDVRRTVRKFPLNG